LKEIIIITPVPNVIKTLINIGIIKKARERNAVKISCLDLREFGLGNYRQIDGEPFGGGKGMIMMAEPFINAIKYAIDSFENHNKYEIFYPSPQGKLWNQKSASKFSNDNNLIILCGHYKGVDQRIFDKFDIFEYSVGDFIMTSGEIPAIIFSDTIIRLLPGALNSVESALTDSFSHPLLDHPHYTKPRKIDGMQVPDVLLSGHHEKIENWKEDQRKKRTKKRRPDLWNKYNANLKKMEIDHG
tara:strand:+ start:1029 stop:1757 length:729 start_codon:yes stop_codon:yes gene_type:complete